MRLAGFPATSPWFRRSLAVEFTDEQISAMEPRNGQLMGIADKRGVMKTARLTVDGQTYEATSQTAGDALRKVLAKREAERVAIVSLLTGPEAVA